MIKKRLGKIGDMREFKFRAWGGDETKYFVYFDLLGQREDSVVQSGDENPRDLLYHKDIDIIEQYTGLKDRDGTEIYEGDIVEWAGMPPSEIVFRQSAFIESMNRYHLNKESMSHFGKVVGNIHENPELLKK